MQTDKKWVVLWGKENFWNLRQDFCGVDLAGWENKWEIKLQKWGMTLDARGNWVSVRKEGGEQM